MALRVLSLDGGGIRGILPARVLAELEALAGQPTVELFDLVAGTASGAVLALGLSVPSSEGKPKFGAQDLVDLYERRGDELFPHPDPTHRFRHFISRRGARHPAVKPLSESFGETPLGDALVELLIPTFDLTASTPLILRSDEFAPGVGPLMRDVALASSSPPMHYSAVEIELGSRRSDLTHGGLAANNPAPLAYAAALTKAEPSDVLLVSLGTGSPSRDWRNGSSDHSPRRWPLGATRSFELQLEGSSESHHQMMDALLAAAGHRDRYWRLQPTIGPDGHDGLGEATALASIGDQFVLGARSSLTEIADRVVQ